MLVHRDAAVRLLLSNFTDQLFFCRVRRAILRAQGAVAIIIKLFWLLRELAETLCTRAIPPLRVSGREDLNTVIKEYTLPY